MIDISQNQAVQMPYCVICHLRMSTNFNRNEFTKAGNGVLIGPQILLTLGHNLLDFDKDTNTKWNVEKMTVTPCGGFPSHFDSRTLDFFENPNAQLALPQAWITDVNNTTDSNGPIFSNLNRNDYAVIKLQQPFLFPSNQYFKTTSINNNNNLSVEIAGSFLDPNSGNILRFGREELNGGNNGTIQIFNHVFSYNINTDDGQSGSPIFIKDSNQQYYVIGLHRLEVPAGTGWGIRVNPNDIQILLNNIG